MKKLLQVLFHPLLLAVIGVLALSAVLWWLGPMISFGDRRPLDPVWVRAWLIGLMFAVLALKVLFRTLKRRKTNAALVAGMSKGPSASDKELGTLNDRFAQAIDVLKQAPMGGGSRSIFKRGQFLYELPWYIFIGAPGSGKTTALLNAGLTFPLAEKMGSGGVRGVGGTRNCDWWFTDQAVLIDTAGRYTTQESDSAADATAWDGFLALLRKARPRRPINGVLLTVNIQDLLQQNPAERKEHAGKLRARMQELSLKLGVRAPVYVLITKTDLIAGFNESFGDLGKEERNQVWGFSFPYSPQSSEDTLSNFASEFAALEKRLRDRVVDRMDAEQDVLKRAAIFNFPQQFAGIKGLLGGFLEQVFSAGGQLEDRPLLRGVYFTSGTQEGTPIDRVMGTLARTFGVERRLAAVAPARGGKSFFLHRLLRDVIFVEQGLVGENRAMETRRARLRLAGFAATAVVALSVLAGWFVSYGRNKAYVNQIEAKLPELRKAVDSIPPATTSDVSPLPGVLSAVRLAPQPEGFALDSPPLLMSLGLYQGGKLDAGAELGYQRLLEHTLMPRVVRRLEERLRSANRDNLEVAYEGLKAYVMLYTPDKFDAEAFKAWVTVDWDATLERSTSPAQREALAVHLDAMLAQGAPQPAAPIDKALVAGVRDMLVAFPLEYRVFSRLKRAQLGANVPAFTVAGAAGPPALQVFERISGEPLTKGISGLYTKEGFQKSFQLSVEKATKQLAAEESWVLGIRPVDAKPLANLTGSGELTDRVRRLYFEEYIKVWDKYIADLRIVKLTSLSQSLDVARILSAVDSPLAAFMRGVARETTLVDAPKPGAPDINLPAQAGTVKRELKDLMTGSGVAPSGPPLEQMVDDHFASVRRLMQGQPAPIDEVLKLFNEVYVQLAAVDAAQKSKSAPPPSAGADRLKAAAGQQPEPIRAVLESLAGAAATQGRSVELAGLSGELKPISDFCARAIAGRYPFTTSSKSDVPTEDFAQFFGAGGMLDDFYQRRLSTIVDTSTPVWTFKPLADGARPVNAAALADFQRGARIKDVFFRAGGKTPGFRIEIRAVEIAEGLKEIDLDIDGQIFKFSAGNTTPASIQWPSARLSSQIKLSTAGGGAPLIFDGPWALFRLFDRFDVKPTAQPERFIVDMNLEGKTARLEVTASSVFNPFRLREMQQFRCPGAL